MRALAYGLLGAAVLTAGLLVARSQKAPSRIASADPPTQSADSEDSLLARVRAQGL